ncbi:MAG: glycosyltransferase [SAR202 cluster bacterium]|nr:glycosyltransferase [SAR202 cluster bacterium]
MPDRVLFVAYTADWTGPSNSLLLLIRHLGKRVDPLVVMPGEGLLAEALRAERIPYVSVKSLGTASIPGLRRLIKRRGIELVYANTASRVSRNALVASRLAGRPFICHVRSMGWKKKWTELGFLKYSNAVIAVSEACGKSVERFCRPGRLHVIHNGVEIDSMAVPDRQGARRHLEAVAGLPADAFAIISVSHISQRKGSIEAVRAFSTVASSDSRAHLILVGSLHREPAYVDAVRKEIAQGGLQKRVCLTGFREDAIRLMQGADLFLHTAASDPHPRSVVEAMACRLPVVAYSVDGVAETVENGVTGMLVPHGDLNALAASLKAVMSDPGSIASMRTSGPEIARSRFSATATANGVAAIMSMLSDFVSLTAQ